MTNTEAIVPKVFVNSEEEQESSDENVTVKFKISDVQIIAHTYSNNLTFEEVKFDIASKFKVDAKYLQLLHCDTPIPDEQKIIEICRNNFGIIDVHLQLLPEAEFDNVQLDVNVYYSHYTLPDIITVQVPNNVDGQEGQLKELLVEIENKSIVKPFLGGFKDTLNNIEYHDAFTQTGPAFERLKYDDVATRDTQTVQQRDTCEDTPYNRSTQVYGEATGLVHIPNASDYSIVPRPYESHEMILNREKKLKKISLIQKNFRAYMIRMMIKKKASEFRRLLEEQRRRENMIQEIYVNRHKREMVIKTLPVTKEDFDVLYSQIAMWKQREVKKISELHSGAPKIAALNCLLDNEITLLNAIDKQKLALREKAQEMKNDSILKNLGKPKQWIGYNNYIIQMDSLRTQKVRFLTGFYNKMKMTTTKNSRLALIEDIENIIDRSKNQKIVVELENLLYKEKQLLKCDVHSIDLFPLRQRQLVVFLDLIKDEENCKLEKSKARMCHKCKIVRPISEFSLDTRHGILNICKLCADLKVTVIDNSVYRAILRAIRREERKRGALASYAFIIQEADIRFIIENIWHGHSILSQNSNRPDLRLPRWQIGDDWSPWNCICLTENEARAHVKIKYLDKVYEENLMVDIQNKNILAKSAFKRLAAVDYDFVQSGDWWDVGLDGLTI